MTSADIQSILELAQNADLEIRKRVWPGLKSLHEADPQRHQDALAALVQHHQALQAMPHQVRSVADMAAVRAYAPFTVFEMAIEPGYDDVANTAYLKAHQDIEHIALLTLRLGSNYMGDAGAIALIQSGNMPRLRHLDRGHNSLADKTIDALIGSALLPQLQTVTLIWNQCSAEGLAALREANPHLCTDSVWTS